MKDKTAGFIGGGRVVRIILGGFRKAGSMPGEIVVSDSNPDALEKLKIIASRIEGEGIVAILNGMMNRSSRLGIMEEGRVPCLWILGSMDNYIPCDSIQQNVKLPDNAKIVVLMNSGHMGFVEEEAESIRILSDFILPLTR